MHIVLSNRNAIKIEDVLTYTADDDATAGINLQGYPVLGLLVPVLNDTPTVTIEISLDGTNWYGLMESDGSTDAISLAGGAAAFFVGSDELTQLAAFCGAVDNLLVRLATSAAQTADRTFTWIGMA
jgi:hypothetical protein